MKRNQFEVKRKRKEYIVIRKDFPYGFHAHIRSKHGEEILLKALECERLPKSNYLKDSCKRLLTEKEFKGLRKPKDVYINVQNRRG